MKQILFFTTLLFFCMCATAQQKIISSGSAPEHKGVRIEIGMGPVFGSIRQKGSHIYTSPAMTTSGNIDYKYQDTGFDIELKIGGAASKNLVLTFNVIDKVLT